MVTEMECILYDELEQNINEILIQKERSEPNQLSNHDVESPGSNVSHIQLDSNADGASVATPTLPAAEDIYCTVEEETLNFESLPGGDEIVTVLVSYCASSDEFTVSFSKRFSESHMYSTKGSYKIYRLGIMMCMVGYFSIAHVKNIKILRDFL